MHFSELYRTFKACWTGAAVYHLAVRRAGYLTDCSLNEAWQADQIVAGHCEGEFETKLFDTCLYRKLNSTIMVVKAPDDRL